MAGLVVLLFVVQPLMSGGTGSLAATPTPDSAVAPVATPDPASTVDPAAPVPTIEPTAAPTGPSGFSSGDIVGLIARLGVVVVIIFVCMYLLRIWTTRTRGGAATGKVVRVLDTITLGSNRQMFLVDAGDKVLLVGATPTQLNLLSELTNPETLTSLRLSRQPVASATTATVTDLLRRAGNKFAQRREAPAAEAQAFPSMAETLQRMLRGQADAREKIAKASYAPASPLLDDEPLLEA